VATVDAGRDHHYREVAYLAYLAERARPEDTIGSILDRLSDDEFQELLAIITRMTKTRDGEVSAAYHTAFSAGISAVGDCLD
jgi:cytochrome c553